MRRRTLLARAVGSLVPAATPAVLDIYFPSGTYVFSGARWVRVGPLVQFTVSTNWPASVVARSNLPA